MSDFNAVYENSILEYSIFSGIKLYYYDIKSKEIQLHKHSSDVFEIHHCKSGRAQCQRDGIFYYLGQDDFAVFNGNYLNCPVSFPLNSYKGISIVIDIKKSPRCLSCIMEEINISPAKLRDKFCSNNKYMIARSNESIRHIFSELYSVPEKIRLGYCKIKVLELMLFLSEFNNDNKQIHTFTVSQVEIAQKIKNYINENLDLKITISDLSKALNASETLIKSNFKGVFGISIYSYQKQQKIKRASEYLLNTNDTVLSVANNVGYSNASKFAKAFKDIMGVSPKEFRCSN